MKKLLLASSMFALAAVSSQSAMAEVKVRGGVGNTSFALEFINIYTNADVKADLLTTSLGVTYIGESGMYLDVSGSRGGVRNSTTTSSSAPNMKITGRTDAAINVGYAGSFDSGRGYSYYVGYKTGETLATLSNPTLFTPTNDKFSTTGYVVGGGISLLPFDFGGVLGFNVAAARLTTDWSDDAAFSSSSGTSGVSSGVSYTYPISSTFNIAADAKQNVYQYTFNACKNTTANCQVYEKVMSLAVTLSAQF